MRVHFLRAAVLVCAAGIGLMAQQSLTVAKLVTFIESSIKNNLPDKEVAAYLATVKLSERLTPGMVEDLQGKGAGPRTRAALTRLADLSQGLPTAVAKVVPPKPVYVEPPPPSKEEQQKVLAEITDYALNYSKTLPDFICLQVTRRSVDMRYQPGTPGSWSPVDRLLERLTFFDQKEKYEPISVNDRALYGKSWEGLGGSISRGEFGTTLKEIFSPESRAEFGWDHWGRLRNNLTYVFRYRVAQEYSKETINWNNTRSVTPGYTGLVYVQKGPNVILRVTIDPQPPVDFPVQDVHQVIDYHYVDISGQQFLLPFFSTVQMRDGRQGSRNEIEFRSYHKYAAGTSITFEDVDEPLPEDQKTEQKPEQKPPPKQ